MFRTLSTTTTWAAGKVAGSRKGERTTPSNEKENICVSSEGLKIMKCLII